MMDGCRPKDSNVILFFRKNQRSCKKQNAK
jgi:hypothetical protein